MKIKQENIRNFSIVAHIDHGKSTLADRLLEITETVAKRDMQSQILDNMDLERERGITIKAQAVACFYERDGEMYELNLIDTPGHVDFTYEVSRSLQACEGALLVVDASQGIEAQTLANTYLALDENLEIIPVVNKVDLPAADPARVIKEVEDVIGIPAQDAPLISAKTGLNVEQVLHTVIDNVPPPKGDPNAPLQALIFDSYYDAYKGVVVYFRVVEGTIRKNSQIKLMATGATFDITEIGRKTPTDMTECDELFAGEVGYLTASIKNVSDTRVGDTITDNKNLASKPLPGYREVNPVVFCGIYPADGSKYTDLKESLEKLKLNDASLIYEPESSAALGFGFRCGFLGLLHMEIIQERIEREYDIEIITTAPSVIYRLTLNSGETVEIDNPTNYPDVTKIASALEPVCDVHIFAPSEFVGVIMELCQSRRGVYIGMDYQGADRVDINYTLPLNEIVYDFFDNLKSKTRGYASYDYEIKDYVSSKLVKLDIRLAGDIIDALSFIVHSDSAQSKARRIAEKLKDHIPRQMFEVPIQVSIGGKIIARENVKAIRKDVLAKCYGDDITRKKKLLEKQKEGKKRMRKLGSVEVPSEAFMAVLKLDD